MTAKRCALCCQVRIDVEHAAVVMAHDAETVVLHDMGYPGSLDPFADFTPRDEIVFQDAADLEKRNVAALENVGDFWNWTGGTIREPLAGHLRTIAEAIERVEVDRNGWLQVENDDRNFGPPY